MKIEKYLSDPIWWSNHILDNQYEKNLKIDIFSDEQTICTISGIDPNFIIASNCDNPELNYSIQSCGLIDWFFDFTERTEPSKTSSIIATEGEIKDWITDKVQKNTIAIDTNIILNRIFSSLSLMGKDIIPNVKLKIPRLSILELERKANCSKDFEKRKCFLAYGELLYLKNNGVLPMADLNLEILTGFSKISSDKETDASDWGIFSNAWEELSDEELDELGIHKFSFQIF